MQLVLLKNEDKNARHGRHAGRITGGTECYGRHYNLRRSVNLTNSDVLNIPGGCSWVLVPQSHPRPANHPSDLLVEIERVKVLLRC